MSLEAQIMKEDMDRAFRNWLEDMKALFAARERQRELEASAAEGQEVSTTEGPQQWGAALNGMPLKSKGVMKAMQEIQHKRGGPAQTQELTGPSVKHTAGPVAQSVKAAAPALTPSVPKQ